MNNFPSIFDEFNRPMSSWRPLLRQIDDMFNNVMGEQTPLLTERLGEGGMARSLLPACDIEEAQDHYLLSFDMPGLDKANINIETVGNQLLVTGERRDERTSKRGRVFERRLGRFERSITLPDDVKTSDIEAQYKDGVLMIAVPRTAEAKHTRIKIGEGKQGLFQRLVGEGKRVLGREEGKAEVASKSGATGTGAERFEPTH